MTSVDAQLPLPSGGQAYTTERINDVQGAKALSIIGAAVNEVTKTTRGFEILAGVEHSTRRLARAVLASVACAEPSTLLHSMAVSTISPGQLDPVGDPLFFIWSAPWNTSLRESVLSQHSPGSSLRGLELAASMVDTSTATRGAQKFARVASVWMSLPS